MITCNRWRYIDNNKMKHLLSNTIYFAIYLCSISFLLMYIRSELAINAIWAHATICSCVFVYQATTPAEYRKTTTFNNMILIVLLLRSCFFFLSINIFYAHCFRL